jgi:hypothetical protein
MPRRSRRATCPQCGSSEVLRIVYGLPEDVSSEGYAKARREGVRFGGCCIEPDSPTHQCADCDNSWGGQLDEPDASLPARDR